MAYRLFILSLLSMAVTPRLAEQRYSFRYYAHEQGLGNLMAYSVMQDSTGFLWVATGNGLYRYGGNRFSAYRNADGLPDHRVLAVHEAPDGSLWWALALASPSTAHPSNQSGTI